MILLIDNYDSFVHTLARYVAEAGGVPDVRRNDSITPDDVLALNPSAIIISPGPKGPESAGNAVDIVRALAAKVPILGVCLGHQVIAQAFGEAVVRAPRPMHGRASEITHDQSILYDGLPARFPAARYHSLMVSEPRIEGELVINARSEDGLVMGLQHRRYPSFGIQFHPESVLTPDGHRLVENFLAIPSPNQEPSA